MPIINLLTTYDVLVPDENDDKKAIEKAMDHFFSLDRNRTYYDQIKYNITTNVENTSIGKNVLIQVFEKK